MKGVEGECWRRASIRVVDRDGRRVHIACNEEQMGCND